MGEVFWPADEFLAGIDTFQRQNRNFGLQPIYPFGPAIFRTGRSEAHAIHE
jgi:hypothetical protein